MAVQLPSEELGTAVGVLIWSFFCLACSVLMAWLTWVHHERTSYIALFAYFPGLATCASIAQQLHTIVQWEDIKTEQYHHSLAHIREPEVAVAGASTGVDLVLFYIQFYCYNVESLLVFAWAASLAQSIFEVRRFDLLSPRTTIATKAIAILLPVLFMCLLRIEAVQHSTVGFLVIANILMAIGIIGAMILLISIMAKYIHSKVHLQSWFFPYGSRSTTRLTDNDSYAMPVAKRNIYDRWLLLRFCIAFVAMSGFQVSIIIFEITSAQRNQGLELVGGPDLSLERVHHDLVQFMSGVAPGPLAFLVFGTTRAFRDYMWDKITTSLGDGTTPNTVPIFQTEMAPLYLRGTLLISQIAILILHLVISSRASYGFVTAGFINRSA